MNFRNSLRRYNPIELLLWFSLPIASPHRLVSPYGPVPKERSLGFSLSDWNIQPRRYTHGAAVCCVRLGCQSFPDKEVPVWAAEAGARKLRNLHSPMPLSLLADRKRYKISSKRKLLPVPFFHFFAIIAIRPYLGIHTGRRASCQIPVLSHPSPHLIKPFYPDLTLADLMGDSVLQDLLHSNLILDLWPAHLADHLPGGPYSCPP